MSSRGRGDFQLAVGVVSAIWITTGLLIGGGVISYLLCVAGVLLALALVIDLVVE